MPSIIISPEQAVALAQIAEFDTSDDLRLEVESEDRSLTVSYPDEDDRALRRYEYIARDGTVA